LASGGGAAMVTVVAVIFMRFALTKVICLDILGHSAQKSQKIHFMHAPFVWLVCSCF
jgi:hypothetical protein